ncbi:hypothetical protein [Pseudonocardia spinosispora]|uniref:hypothetical protein n=1 Tax=Pseudonocardia spinosispora TaxID=103441 RepID=UPI0012EB55B4|nr:hypothetical protein [Pseudonocardia spinosispora]
MDEVRELPADQRVVRRLAAGPTRLTVLAEHRQTGKRSVFVTFGPELSPASSDAVAALGHPHILPLRTAGPGMLSAQVPDGADLVAFAPNGGSPSAELAVLTQVADALDAAHRVGAVHGDLRAEDALVDVRTGHVCLAGFGLYPPGTPVGPANDQRSLGAVLAHCLPPHRPALADVLQAAYAARYPTCRALVDAARAALPAEAPAPSPKRTRRRRTVIGAALALVVAVAAGVIATPHIVASFGPTDGELTRMPAAVRGACALAGPEGLPPGSDRQLRCHGADGQDMTAGLYDSAADAEAGYRAAVAATPSARTGDGDCSNSPGWEHSYPGVGAPTGRVLCVRDNTGARMVWLNRTDRTVSTATRSDGDALALYQAWARWVEIPAFPAAQEKDLMALLVETDCRRAPAGAIDAVDGAVASVDCTPLGTGASTVRYLRFSDSEHLDRAYRSDVEKAGGHDGVDCSDPKEPTFLGDSVTYVLSVPFGRLACRPGPGAPTLTMSIDSLMLMGIASGPDRTALVNWLSHASSPRVAPLVGSLNQRSQFPTAQERQLLDHIPAGSPSICTRPTEKQVGLNVKGARVVGAACLVSTLRGGSVFYYQYADHNELLAAGGPSGGPDCLSDPPGFFGSARYTRPNGSTGTLQCGPTVADAATFALAWTDERTDIRVMAFSPDRGALLAWWRSGAGPE